MSKDHSWTSCSLARMLILITALSLIATSQAEIYTGKEKIITIPDGKVKGSILETLNGREFVTYLGIPYGRAPIGNLRFQPPERVEPWEGVLDGTKSGEFCIQYDQSTGYLKGTEDCLTLNVSTPQMNDTFHKLYPVIVYIFGGIFLIGPQDQKGPERLLDSNIVHVAPNHRLGILGYASTNDEYLSGDYGQLDQIFAFKWVQENIAYFGGDPNRVTLMGHSSGSISTMTNIISPLSNGLIHGAIMLSGCRICKQEQDYSVTSTLHFATRSNCSTNTSKSIWDCFMNISASDLYGNYEKIRFPFIPNFHNNSEYLPHPIMDMPFQSNVNKIPVIIGILPNDGAVLVQGKNRTFKEHMDDAMNAAAILEFKKASLKDRLLQAYNLTESTGKTTQEALNIMQDMATDTRYKHCCDKSVELLAKAGFPTYTYLFKNHGSVTKKNYNVREYDHSDELDLIFTSEANWNLTGNDLLTSKAALHYITNFVTYGDPSPRNVTAGPETYPKWEPWTEDHPRHIVLERSPFMENGSFCTRKKFWDEYTDIIYKY